MVHDFMKKKLKCQEKKSVLLLLELSYNNVDFLLALFSVKQNHLGSQI